METITIQPLKLTPTRICLGTWAIGGTMWGGSDEQKSLTTIKTAIDRGITMIDTAPVYGFGKSEEIVGKAVKEYGQRDKLVIATKVGLEWRDDKIFRNSTPERITQEIHDSLKRLQTDYIDIYQIHWPDTNTPFEKTAQTMLKLFEEGKIRAIGVSNFSVVQMQRFMKIAPIHTTQPPYNLFERAVEESTMPFTEQKGIVTLAYGSLCRGLLSGKMNKDTTFKGDDIRRNDPKFQAPRFQMYLNAVNALDAFAREKYGKTVLALAVRWVLDKGHTIALWGARVPEQLNNIDEVMGWSLDAEAMRQIDYILKENITDPVGPEFMAPPTLAT